MISRYSDIPLGEQLFDRVKTQARVLRYKMRYVFPQKDILGKIEKFRNLHQGATALVMGNGPSLKKYDLGKIKKYQENDGFKVFAVNSYIVSEYAKIITPDYYVLSDPAHLGLFANKDQEEKTKVLHQTLHKTTFPLFIPIEFYHNIDGVNKFAFCDVEDLYSKNINDPLKPRCYVSLTILKTFMLALFMGHKRIYFCGVDGSDFKHIIVNSKNEIFYDYRHFYNDQKNVVRYPPGYNSVAEILYSIYLDYISFGKFSKCSIVNMDPDCLIDCFSKDHQLDVFKAGV